MRLTSIPKRSDGSDLAADERMTYLGVLILARIGKFHEGAQNMGEPLAGTRGARENGSPLSGPVRVHAKGDRTRTLDQMRSRASYGYEAKAPPEAPVTMSPTDAPSCLGKRR